MSFSAVKRSKYLYPAQLNFFSRNLALCKSKDNKNKTLISDVSMGTLVKLLNFRPFCILYLLLPFQIITPISIFAVDFGYYNIYKCKNFRLTK